MFIIQGIMSGILICHEFSVNDSDQAVTLAKGLLKDPTFEGDSTRVITIDSELVWDSTTEKDVPT